MSDFRSCNSSDESDNEPKIDMNDESKSASKRERKKKRKHGLTPENVKKRANIQNSPK